MELAKRERERDCISFLIRSIAVYGSIVPFAGPFGEQDDEQVFVQKVVPETDQLFVRLASNGKRVCVIHSVDGSIISSFYVHECEGSSRMGSRPRRFIFTGHSNGTIQMWDLTTALDPSFNATQSMAILFLSLLLLLSPSGLILLLLSTAVCDVT